jgi:hypothetical protein
VPFCIFIKEKPTVGDSKDLLIGILAKEACQRFLADKISGLFFFASSSKEFKERLSFAKDKGLMINKLAKNMLKNFLDI